MAKLLHRSALTLALLALLGVLASTASAASGTPGGPAADPAFPESGGAFVIGDGNAVVGSTVTFWGAQWWKENTVSGGTAPPAFKGFALIPAIPSCGDFTTDPGNSPPPPAGPLPDTITVLVTSSVTKSGPTISGTVTNLAVVLTDPGYEGNPGHAGTGTVIALGCGGE